MTQRDVKRGSTEQSTNLLLQLQPLKSLERRLQNTPDVVDHSFKQILIFLLILHLVGIHHPALLLKSLYLILICALVSDPVVHQQPAVLRRHVRCFFM
jgi:hypothetical protein